MSVSHGSRSRPAGRMPLSLIQTQASQSLGPGHDLRLRLSDVDDDAHEVGDSDAEGSGDL